MDNTEFNKLFEVFTNDPQNAMYILNFSLMEQLIKLQKMLKDPLSVSFVDNRIFSTFFLFSYVDRLEVFPLSGGKTGSYPQFLK